MHVAHGPEEGDSGQRLDGWSSLWLSQGAREWAGNGDRGGGDTRAEEEVDVEERAQQGVVDDVALDDNRCRPQVRELPRDHHDHHPRGDNAEVARGQQSRQDDADSDPRDLREQLSQEGVP